MGPEDDWCGDYHCAGDCGLRGPGWQHAQMSPQLQAAAEHLKAQYDEIVKRAVSEALGRQDWTPDELQGRLHAVLSPGGDTYSLDDRPLLWMGPARVAEAAGGAITVDREWRMLW